MMGVPIRSLVIGGLLMSIFFIAYITGVGGLAGDNGVYTSNSIASQYNKLTTNTTNGTVIAGISPILNQSNNQQKIITNSTFSTGLFTSVNLVGYVFSTLFSAWSGYIGFISTGLAFVGIQSTTIATIVGAMIIIIVVLSIISAVLLFPQ